MANFGSGYDFKLYDYGNKIPYAPGLQAPQYNLADAKSIPYVNAVQAEMPGGTAPSAPVAPSLKAPAMNDQSGAMQSKFEDYSSWEPASIDPINTSGERLALARQIGTQIVDNIVAQKANVAANEYSSNMAKWREEGKYWFDPNSDLQPDIDEYLSNMPSVTDSLLESHLGSGADAKGGSRGAIAGIASGNIFSPIFSAAGNENAAKAASHIFHKGGERALQGTAMGGWVGAIVGGAVGIVEGIFGWQSAKEEDEKNKKEALRAYERDLAKWTEQRSQKISAINSAMAGQRQAKKMAASLDAKAESEKTAGKKAQRAAQVFNSFMSAMKYKNVA